MKFERSSVCKTKVGVKVIGEKGISASNKVLPKTGVRVLNVKLLLWKGRATLPTTNVSLPTECKCVVVSSKEKGFTCNNVNALLVACNKDGCKLPGRRLRLPICERWRIVKGRMLRI